MGSLAVRGSEAGHGFLQPVAGVAVGGGVADESGAGARAKPVVRAATGPSPPGTCGRGPALLRRRSAAGSGTSGVPWLQILRNSAQTEVAVSLVPAAVELPAVAERAPPRSRTSVSWLIAGGYLLGALIVTARLWADPAGRMPVGNAQDVNMFAWFLRYSATASAHGEIPELVTTALNAPRGVNVMWNTSFLLPGILLSPVTLLAGPQVSLTITLTLSIAGSADSLFWVLRRWGASVSAAALGGAVYGFSPALLNSGLGHYNLAFAVLPPLIIDALLPIVTRRGHAVRTGAWMGLLTAAQLLIGEEALIDTALAGLVLVVVVALGHPRAVGGRARATALGVVTGAAVTLLIRC